MSYNCYGCGDMKRNSLGERTRCSHDEVFTDSRTGRAFCHECIAALVTWELDGCPEPEEHPSLVEWIGAVDLTERCA